MMAVFLVVGLVDNAHAQPTTNYEVGTCFSRGFDSWTIDTCFFILFDGTIAADTGIAVTIDTAQYAGRTDSLCFSVHLNATTINKARNPWGLFIADLSDGRRIHDRVDFSHVIHAVDTARESFATATVDYDSIAALIAAGAAGSGSEPVILYVIDSTNDAIVPYAKIVVRSADTSSIEGILAATVGGFAAFSLDSLASYPVDVAASGFYMQTAYQLVTVPVGGFTDTLYVYARSFTPPAGGDSCAVVIFTNDAGATAHISIIETDGNQDTSGVALTTHVEVAAADAFGTIQFSLPRTASTRQKTQWRIDVRDGFNKVMLSVPKYTVPNQAIDTLLAPLKNQ